MHPNHTACQQREKIAGHVATSTSGFRIPRSMALLTRELGALPQSAGTASITGLQGPRGPGGGKHPPRDSTRERGRICNQLGVPCSGYHEISNHFQLPTLLGAANLQLADQPCRSSEQSRSSSSSSSSSNVLYRCVRSYTCTTVTTLHFSLDTSIFRSSQPLSWHLLQCLTHPGISSRQRTDHNQPPPLPVLFNHTASMPAMLVMCCVSTAPRLADRLCHQTTNHPSGMEVVALAISGWSATRLPGPDGLHTLEEGGGGPRAR